MIGKGDFAGASAVLEKVVATRPGQQARLALSRLLLHQAEEVPRGARRLREAPRPRPRRPAGPLQHGRLLRPRGQQGRGVRVARQGEGDREDRHDADPGRRRPEASRLRPALRRAPAEARGLRQPLRRVRERQAPPGMGRRDDRRPVRLDRAEPRRRRRRRCGRFRHLRARLGRHRQGRRPRLRLLDEDGQAPLESRRRRRGRARHGRRARGRREQGRHSRRRRRRAGRRQGLHLLGQGRPRPPDADGRGEDRHLRPPRHVRRRREPRRL